MGEQFKTERACLTPLPAFVFDTGKSLSVRVADNSLIQFERNHYSVPVHLVGREVGVKAHGNFLECYYRGEVVAQHDRLYGRGHTSFELEHYIPLLERKPRAVFNAKPVRHLPAHKLLEWGRTFPEGAKDTVRLLKLSIEHGLDKVLEVKEKLPPGVTPTIAMVENELLPPGPIPIFSAKDIPVNPIDLKVYDTKYKVVAQ